MALLPYRETVAIDFYSKHFSDGRHEISAFFKTPLNGWCPMIAIWSIDPGAVEGSPEDIIEICGSHFAYCISDETPSDFEGLKPTGPTMIGPTHLLAIGALMRRVI